MLGAAGGLRAVGGDAAVMAEQATSGLAGLLRQLRAEAQLTQQELAKAAGVSPRAVSDLERGIHRTARQDTAVRLAGALGLAEPVRSLFVAAALGRTQAGQVLAARSRQPPGESLAPAGGLHGFVRSGSFFSAISRSWAWVMRPTFSRCGSPEPFSRFAACLMSTAAGGVLVMKVNERSS